MFKTKIPKEILSEWRKKQCTAMQILHRSGVKLGH